MDVGLALSAARIATAALAGTISLLAWQAFRRSHHRNILALSVGAGLLALGYVTQGILVTVLSWDLQDATVVESVTTLAACMILVVSLYMRQTATGRVTPISRRAPP